MTHRRSILLVAVVGLWLCSCSGMAASTAFTYQGQLKDGATPLSGNFDFTFTLFDASASGNAVGTAVTKTGVALTNGLFTVELDFGVATFDGSDRWLEVAYAPAGGAQTVLSPRQKLNPTPYAIRAATIDDGAVSTVKLADAAVSTAKLADAAVSAVKLADGVVSTTKLADAAVSTAKLADGAATDAKISTVSAAKLSGTVSATNGGTGLSSPGAAGNLLRSDGTTWTSSAIQAADLPLQATVNPQQVALLRWYQGNRGGFPPFATGNVPQGAAFDGENIWVANNTDYSVNLYRASDGNLVATYSTGAAGAKPVGMAYDGAYMWVANNGDGTLQRIRARDGFLSNIPSPGGASAGFNVVYAGNEGKVWVSDKGLNVANMYRAIEGAFITTAVLPVGSQPYGIAYDGSKVWTANHGTNNISRFNATDGSAVVSFAAGTQPYGIAFDGRNMWVSNEGSNNVMKFRASDGALQGTFNVGTAPRGVVFDGAAIWVANFGSNNVTKLNAADGSLIGTFTAGTGPTGMAFDGANVWVTNETENTVSKL